MGVLDAGSRVATRSGSVVRLTPSRVAALLRQRVENEAVTPGDKFLSVREIAADYGVSSGTAHQVIRILAEQGVIETRPRSGTVIKYVATPAAERGRRTRAIIHLIIGRPDVPSQSLLSDSTCDGLLECWPGVSAQINVLPEQNPIEYLDELFGREGEPPEVVGVVLIRCPREVKQYFAQRRLPAVVEGHVDEDIDLVFIDRDQNAIGQTVANYLLDRGHRHLGLLMYNHWLPGDNLFLAAIQRATTERAMSADHLAIHSVPVEPALVRAGVQAMIDRPDHVTAIICRSDPLALECLAVAKQLHLKVPADLAIVSVGENSRLLEAADPPITSMSRDAREIGRLTGELLKNVIRGQRIARLHVELPSVLVERQST